MKYQIKLFYGFFVIFLIGCGSAELEQDQNKIILKGGIQNTVKQESFFSQKNYNLEDKTKAKEENIFLKKSEEELASEQDQINSQSAYPKSEEELASEKEDYSKDMLIDSEETLVDETVHLSKTVMQKSEEELASEQKYSR